MGVTAGIFLASILLKEMRYLVYIRYQWPAQASDVFDNTNVDQKQILARNGGHQAVGRAGSCFLDNSVHYVDQWFSFGKYKMAVYFY
jgi:hypothetical protein